MTDTEKYLESLKEAKKNVTSDLKELDDKIAKFEERVKYEKAVEKRKNVANALKEVKETMGQGCGITHSVVIDPNLVLDMYDVVNDLMSENVVLDDLCKAKDEKIIKLKSQLRMVKSWLAQTKVVKFALGKRKYKPDEVMSIVRKVCTDMDKECDKLNNIIKGVLDE